LIVHCKVQYTAHPTHTSLIKTLQSSNLSLRRSKVIFFWRMSRYCAYRLYFPGSLENSWSSYQSCSEMLC